MSTTNPLLEHGRKMYTAFEESPCTIVADEEFATEYNVPEGTQVYIGYWSNEFASRDDLPRASTQQRAVTFLNNCGCIEQLRRGGRDYPSVYRLVHPPQNDDLKNQDGPSFRPSKVTSLENSTIALLKRVDELEAQTDALNLAYNDLAKQIERFQSEIDAVAAHNGLDIVRS